MKIALWIITGASIVITSGIAYILYDLVKELYNNTQSFLDVKKKEKKNETV